mmetsp:Transcript_44071/g.80784  ORF Transcript_44071/g.80784 Transcript_44071/m.80784 type:complete len:366 (-) Transcript_44071:132-1229(-)
MMAAPGRSLMAILISAQLAASVKREVQAVRGASGEIVQPWDGKSVQDLHREYGNIFKHGNRNAASHLWSSFLLDRAPFMSAKKLEKLAAGYCAVSGSPVTPMSQTRYKMSLDRVDGSGKQVGFMYYCCWPCVCDTQDFIRVDTKTIKTRDGPKEYKVAVIGNPCNRPQELTRPFTQPFDKRMTTIAESAAEVRCGPGGRLEGATMSDNRHVIISLFFDASKDTGGLANDEYKEMCEDRKNNGYNSGMGEIFRRVAAISPVEIRPRFALPDGMSAKEMRIEAVRRGLDTRGIADKAELLAILKESQGKELRKLSVKQLRAEAARRGLDLRGIADKADLLRLFEGKASDESCGASAPGSTCRDSATQ